MLFCNCFSENINNGDLKMKKRLLYIESLAVILFLLLSNYNSVSQNTHDSIYHEGIYRTYQTHLPPLYNPLQSYPLVFVLHGGGGNAEYMSAYTQFNITADTANFIVVYPEGIYTGPNFAGAPGHQWADGRMVLLPDSLGIDDVDFFDKLIDTLSLDYNIESSCIFATGISNGGIMCQRLASELSNKFAAVASVAASFPDSLVLGFNPTNPISVLFMNGTNDPITPVYLGGTGLALGSNIATDSMITLWINHNLCTPSIDSISLPNIVLLDFSTVTKYTYGGCQDSVEIVFYKIINGGHTWPQENDTLHVPFTGYCNKDINGTNEIWSFFSTHCKNQITGTNDLINSKENKLNIKIHPNPTSGNIQIELDKTYDKIIVNIRNLIGQLVKTEKFNSIKYIPINLSGNKGVYFVEVISVDSKSITKVIKQ
jgi:polyhydroxybutyrate depolymerase